MDKAALGQVFSEYFRFPFKAFHRLLHTHHHPVLVKWASIKVKKVTGRGGQ
jgi:hypothetical protein